MNEIKEYNETMFESIKHIDEYGMNIGKHANYKMF